MKKWQSILSQHHNVEILSDTKIKVLNVIYDTINKITSDDIVIRIETGYIDSEGHNYKSIYEYLGY
jgi:transketolase N-terminal domain/subunit